MFDTIIIICFLAVFWFVYCYSTKKANEAISELTEQMIKLDEHCKELEKAIEVIYTFNLYKELGEH